MTFELRVGKLNGNDRRETFSNVVSGKVRLVVFEQLRFPSVVVADPGEGGAKTGDVSTALDSVDVVHEAQHRLLERIVVLKGHLNGHFTSVTGIDNPGDIERRIVDRVLRLVEKRDKLSNTALVAEIVLLIRPLLRNDDIKPLIQEGQFSKPGGQSIEIELGHLKDGVVRPKTDNRTGLFVVGRLRYQLGIDQTLGKRHGVLLAFPVNLDLKFVGESVHYRHADPVKTTGHFVSFAFKLTSGMKLGHDHLNSGHPFRGVDGHGNSPTVVPDFHSA